MHVKRDALLHVRTLDFDGDGGAIWQRAAIDLAQRRGGDGLIRERRKRL